MPSTLERARTAVATSPELRRLVERGRAILLGPSDEALRQERDESHWQPAVAAGSRWWQTALSALSGVMGATVIAASAPRWRLAVPSWRLSIPGIAQPGTSTQSTMWFLLGLILFGLGWLGLVYRAGRIADPRRAVVIVGAVICVVGIVVGKVMQMMGMGAQPKSSTKTS